jgi:hypothetical protein
MKQMIVLMATIILGIALSAMILGFRDTAQDITDSTTDQIESGLEFEEYE